MAVNPSTGTRTEPMDAYKFVRGTTATFKFTPESDLKAIALDTGSTPRAYILEPMFLNNTGVGPVVLATLDGTLVTGQEYEYQFTWDIPVDRQPMDDYIVQYVGQLGGQEFIFGNEYFTILAFPEQISMRTPSYATVSDVRMAKFNIDSFLPQIYAKDLTARNAVIEYHLRNAATKLREELALFQIRSNKENYKLFCVYYAIYTILLGARGEDGSSVSDSNLGTWKQMWRDILAQEKRQGAMSQGISLGRG